MSGMEEEEEEEHLFAKEERTVCEIRRRRRRNRRGKTVIYFLATMLRPERIFPRLCLHKMRFFSRGPTSSVLPVPFILEKTFPYSPRPPAASSFQ